MTSHHHNGKTRADGDGPGMPAAGAKALEARHRARLRAVLGLACVTAVLAAPTRATLFFDIDFPDANERTIRITEAGSDYWTSYSEDCGNVNAPGGGTGPGCAQADRPGYNPNQSTAGAAGPALFSWGYSGDATNSVVRLTNTGTSTLALHSLGLRSNESGLGPALGPSLLPTNPTTGAGSMVAYEQPSGAGTANESLYLHNAQEQRVSVYHLDPDNPNPSEQRRLVADNYSVIFGTSAAPDAWSIAALDENPAPYLDYLTGDGIIEYPIHTELNMAGTILKPDDTLELVFFEYAGLWNNSALATDRGFPDAYYGAMDVVFNPAADAPAIAVSDVALGRVRAGTPSAPGEMAISNVGDPGTTLDGRWDDVTASLPAGLTATPGAAEQAFSIAEDGGSDTRTFAYQAGDLGLNDTAPRTMAFTQTISDLNDPDIASGTTSRTVTASTVGPVLGVHDGALDAGDPALTPADVLAYDIGTPGVGTDTLDLGSVEIGGDLVRELVLANLFGSDFGNLTTLTIFNVGIEGADAGFFAVSGGAFPNLQLGAGTDTRNAVNPFQIIFTPDAARDFVAQLVFSTDMNTLFGDDSDPTLIRFTLRGSGIGAAVLPQTGLLMLAGLVSLVRVRRRWGR